MRRLAASIARSAETARTLPGRLSRSLAPSRAGRRRRLANLALLGLAMVPFLVAWVTLEGRGGHGEWQVVWERALRAPGAAAVAVPGGSGLVGSRVRFDRHQVRADAPLACRRAGYQWLRQDRQVVLAALLAGDAAAEEAVAGLPALVTTLRVDCAGVRFDYHQAGDALLVRVGGHLLRLVGH